MNKLRCSVALYSFCLFSFWSAHAEPLLVTERGPNHRKIEFVSQGLDAQGQAVNVTNRYTELKNGVSYKGEDGVWKDTEEVIELLPEGGAVARKGPHRLAFLPNLNTPGAITLTDSSGQTFRSRIFGLCYFDPVSGQSVLIAELKDSIGELTSSNTVTYFDAFTDFKIDVRFSYFCSGFEQDLLIRENLASPLEWGLPETSILQIMTEFETAPELRNRAETNSLLPQTFQTAPKDQTLDFGEMIIGEGRAFSLDEQPESGKRVEKQWETMEGRTFLIEEIEYLAIKADLEKLPDPPPVREVRKTQEKLKIAEIVRRNPVKVAAKTQGSIRKYAGAKPTGPAFLVDYILLSTAANTTLASDSTYFVNSAVILSGVTTIEGGTVVKYSTSGKITIQGVVNCLTESYRLAILTAKDDNTIGETISGSTGTPSGYYAITALYLDNNISHLHDIRISHAQEAIYYDSDSNNPHQLKHAAIVHCQRGIQPRSSPFYLQNVLMSDVLTNFYNATYNVTGIVEHLTIHQSEKLNASTATITLKLTNSLFIAVTNFGSMQGEFNGTNSSSTGVFTSVGAGYHYLPSGSPFRNAGTTNIGSKLRRELGKKTTEAPIIISNVTISLPTTWSPQARRDTDLPDLGYHYYPIDFSVSEVVMNTTLCLTNGVAIGIFGPEGFKLGPGAVLVSQGSPSPISMNQIFLYQTVQEQSVPWGNNSTMMVTRNIGPASSPYPILKFRFTQFSIPSGPSAKRALHSDNGYPLSELSFSDSQLQGSLLMNSSVYSQTVISLTNNVLDRTYLSAIHNGATGYPLYFYAYNNLFFGGSVQVIYGDTPPNYPWKMQDNVFDSSTNLNEGGPFLNSYNGYINSAPFGGSSGGDVTNTTFKYVSGPLGRFYQWSTNFVNAGSRNSTNAGLYHHTIKLDQSKEGSSQVDIGFHFVAVTNTSATTSIWHDEYVTDNPPGGTPTGDSDGWNYVTTKYNGTYGHQSASSSGTHQHYFTGAATSLTLTEDDTLFAYITNSGTLPNTVMLQFLTTDASWWNHRAFWGPDNITLWGTRSYLGSLPPAHGWMRLEVPATAVDLQGRTLQGMAYTLNGGQSIWDYAGKVTMTGPYSAIDTDGDGFPDYLEDRNGNGVGTDTGERDWQTSQNGTTSVPGLQVFNAFE